MKNKRNEWVKLRQNKQTSFAVMLHNWQIIIQYLFRHSLQFHEYGIENTGIVRYIFPSLLEICPAVNTRFYGTDPCQRADYLLFAGGYGWIFVKGYPRAVCAGVRHN